jgi:glycosyltransferase involved in cell wall biosynthesis
MLIFTLRLLHPRITADLHAPDIIIGSTVHPLAAWAAAILAKRHNVPFIYEIRDIWPDTLVDLGAIKAGRPLDRALSRLSDWLIERAVIVVSPLPRIARYLVDRGFSGKPCSWIPNGVDLELMDESSKSHQAEQIATAPFCFMYLGSLGFGNGLDVLIRAFSIALCQAPGLSAELLLIGGGPLKRTLVDQARASSAGLHIHFSDRVPRTRAVDRARQADCLVAPIAALPVLSYGISPNKHFDYMLAGRPILASAPYSGTPVEEARAGIVVPPGDAEALANAMLAMVALSPAEREAMGIRGREFVLSRHTYKILAHELAVTLESWTL